MNGLITKQGKIIECNGGTSHDVICKCKFGCDLNTFLFEQNGVRICANRTELVAIEYHAKLSIAQQRIIRRILRNNNYYTAVLVEKTIRKSRPIRNIEI